MKFVGRQVELDMLNRFYRGRRAGLMILYGRRRVGKTQLLAHWIRQHKIDPVLYWTAAVQTAPLQLRDFSQALIRFDPSYGSLPSPDFSFADWDKALDQLGQIAERTRGPLVVIIDEFTHLMRADRSLASVLQRVWDHRLSHISNLRLILTGSLIGVMENQVISAQAPLYGRATMQYRLRALPFGQLRELFPSWSPAERVAVFAVCGGIPGYLELFAGAGRFTEGLGRALSSGSILLTDPTLLISDQLRDPAMYESVLSALGSGYHAWGDIARMSAVAETNLGFYVKQLSDLELIERREPVLAPPRSHRGRYHIRDPFLRFYYRFVVPNRTAVQRGDQSVVLDAARADLRAFIGTYVFEELCREWAWSDGGPGGLGFVPEEVGSYWKKERSQPVQLDVVAVRSREKRLFIGEAKWEEGHIARSVLTDLMERSRRMPQVVEPGWKVQYGLFSRAGFTPAAVDAAKEVGARLVSLPQLEDRLVEAARRRPTARTDDIKF